LRDPGRRDGSLRRALFALLAVTALCYASLAAAGFVWDDKPLVLDNTVTHSLANLPAFFTLDLWETAGGVESESGYYRPLMLLSLALDRALWGLSPAGHHLHSLAWHLLAVGLLSALLRECVPTIPAMAGATLFALHPVQSEAVAWVAARNDLMVAALVFGAVLALKREKLVLGGLLALAALLSKESGIFALALLLAVQRGRASPRQILALGLAGLAWFGLRNGVAGIGGASVPGAVELSFLGGLLPDVGAHFGGLLLRGGPLSVGATLEYIDVGGAVIALVWSIGLGLGGLMLWRGRGLALGGLLFALLALAPAVLAIAVRGQLGERYLYMPMAGLALAVASAVPSVRTTSVFTVVLGLVSAVMLGQRVPDWTHDLSLWDAAVQTTPNGFSHASLGHEVNLRSSGTESCALFRQALEAEPAYIDVCTQAVRCALKRGDLNEAALGAELTSRVCPATPQQVGLEGMVWLQRCEVDRIRPRAVGLDELNDARLPLVLAVLARHDGDAEGYGRIRESVPDPASFDGQVDTLLGMCP
jgi:protein O-mannosyl-transferase